MDKALKKQTEEWFERGKHDIEMAQLIFDEGGYTDTIAHLIQQSVEKYLTGFLVLNGIGPKKIHDLGFLLGQAIEFRKNLQRFRDLCDKATKFYIEDRYPPCPPVMYSREEIEDVLEEAKELVTEVRKTVDLET